MTYTYATMEVSVATFKEIEAKLRAAGYQDQIIESHSWHDAGLTLDMHGIAIVQEVLPHEP